MIDSWKNFWVYKNIFERITVIFLWKTNAHFKKHLEKLLITNLRYNKEYIQYLDYKVSIL